MQVLLQRLAKIEVIHLQNKIQNCVSAISRIGSISEPKTTILLFSKSKSRAFEQNWPFRRWSLTNCPQSKSSDCQSLSGLKSYRRQILFYFRKRSNLPNWNVLAFAVGRRKTTTRLFGRSSKNDRLFDFFRPTFPVKLTHTTHTYCHIC